MFSICRFLLPTLLDDFQNIIANRETVEAATNTQAQLKCIASYPAFLEAETFWMFQGVMVDKTGLLYHAGTNKLNSTDLTRTEQMNLWINNISDPDFGRYSCVVNTSLGMSSASVFVVKTETGKGKMRPFSWILTPSWLGIGKAQGRLII